jgi:hypothetical protein
MLKTLLLGGAFAIALPAFAQAPASHAPVNAGTAQTTAHDPLQTQDDATMQSTSTPATNASAAGRVSSTSPGIRAGLAAPTDKCTMAVARNSRHAMKRNCVRADGAGIAANTSGMSGYTGMGGPDMPARNYPRCSRTVRDSCVQSGRSQTR